MPDNDSYRRLRAEPRSDETIRREATVALNAMEGYLRERGLRIVCGAELSFFTVNKDGTLYNADVDLGGLENRLKRVTLVEGIGRHRDDIGRYQVQLGTLNRDPQTISDPSSLVAESVDVIKRILPEWAAETKAPFSVSFKPAHLDANNPYATAGLHINTSLFTDSGNNLFYDIGRQTHSGFQKRCALTLLELQKEGLALYAPAKEFYERFAESVHGPQYFHVSERKGSSTITIRPFEWENLRGASNAYRMEDRLAAAQSNPYLPILLGVGAIYLTVDKITGSADKPLPQYRMALMNHREPDELPDRHEPIIAENARVDRAIEHSIGTLANSHKIRRIAGTKLFKDLLANVRSQDSSFAGPGRP